MSSPIRARREAGRTALWAYLDTLHLPPIAAVLVAASGMTAATAGGWPPAERIAPYLASILLTQLSISLHNGYCDRDLDARSKPWRMLPRGLMTPSAALRLAFALAALGLLAAAPLGGLVVALVALGTAAGWAYNAGLKRGALSWAPFWVALTTLAVCSAAVGGQVSPRLWLAYPIAAPIAVSIHVVDTLPDVERDYALGVRGLVHRLGPRRALLVCWAGLGLSQAMALGLWPAPGRPGPLFFASVALLAAAVALGRGGTWRGHWLAVMASATTLAVGWVAALAAQ